MRFLYIFPHPDDESYGPAAVMHQQLRDGHEVHLLTLTKGGATKQRHKFNYSIEEMGEVRYKEMQNVEKTLALNSMTVWDFPDSGLKHEDPRKLERKIGEFIKELKPDIIVSYPVHGISGFHDHLVMHAVIIRVYLQLKEEGHDYIKRLAFFTIPDNGGPTWTDNGIRIKQSKPEEMDCIISLTEVDQQKLIDALMCYESYMDVIKESNVQNGFGDKAYFEIYQEDFDPPLQKLEDQIS